MYWSGDNGSTTATIYKGDALDVLRRLPDNSFHAVVTDPPYGIDYQSGWVPRDKRREKIANDTLPFIWWLHDAYRLTKDGGSLVCFCRWDVQDAFRSAIEWSGYKVKSQVIWDRGIHGMGDLRSSFAPTHDVIWFAVKGNFSFPSDRPSSVVRVPRVTPESLLHPNQKPTSLMSYLIRNVVKPGETILDPFMGSGSTLVAAVSEGCNAVGIELEDKYCDIAAQRIEKEQQQIRLPV